MGVKGNLLLGCFVRIDYWLEFDFYEIVLLVLPATRTVLYCTEYYGS